MPDRMRSGHTVVLWKDLKLDTSNSSWKIRFHSHTDENSLTGGFACFKILNWCCQVHSRHEYGSTMIRVNSQMRTGRWSGNKFSTRTVENDHNKPSLFNYSRMPGGKGRYVFYTLELFRFCTTSCICSSHTTPKNFHDRYSDFSSIPPHRFFFSLIKLDCQINYYERWIGG